MKKLNQLKMDSSSQNGGAEKRGFVEFDVYVHVYIFMHSSEKIVAASRTDLGTEFSLSCLWPSGV